MDEHTRRSTRGGANESQSLFLATMRSGVRLFGECGDWSVPVAPPDLHASDERCGPLVKTGSKKEGLVIARSFASGAPFPRSALFLEITFKQGEKILKSTKAVGLK